MLEYYDFFVYVALTSTLTHLFLPSTDRTVATMAGVATFGIAYVARPLGTIIFSPMADRIGRKKTFVITLAIMGIATVGIGCLPTYAMAGLLAPIGLVTLRVVQGIALGGEYGSAVVYVMEHAPAGRKGMATSVLQSTASLGLLLALALGGEYGSAVVYVMEQTPTNQKNKTTSVLQSTASLGLLLALAIVSA